MQLLTTFSYGFNKKHFGPCSLSLPAHKDLTLFVTPPPFEHEVVSTLEAKITGNF